MITQDTTITLETLKSQDFHVAENVTLNIVALLTKGWEEKAVLNFYLEGSNSQVNFLAIIIGKDENQFPFETISHHTKENTKGFYYTRAVLFDRAQVEYKGNLIIPRTGQLANTYLSHNTLMLSKDAKTNSVPCLEIEADDVKAGHAATIGNVDDELLFYLQSRGIPKEEAKTMLVKGFLEADLHRIPEEATRTQISASIEKFIQNVPK